MPVSWLTKLCNQGESLQQWIVDKQTKEFFSSNRNGSSLYHRRRQVICPSPIWPVLKEEEEDCRWRETTFLTFEANDAIARDVHLLQHFVHFRVGELFAEIGHHVSRRRCEERSFFLSHPRESSFSSGAHAKQRF
jgi:hypothetical protein